MPIDGRAAQQWRRLRTGLLLVWGVLAGCGLLLTTPTVEVKDVAIVGIAADGLDLELLLTVTNANAVSLTLTGYTYDLQVSALPLTKGGARQRVEFKAEGTTAVRLPIRLNYASLFELLKRRVDPDQIPYRLQAGLQVETPLGERVIAIDRDGMIAIPKRYRPAEWYRTLQGAVRDLLPTP